MSEVKLFVKIEKEVMDAIVNYLNGQPHGNVAGIFKALETRAELIDGKGNVITNSEELEALMAGPEVDIPEAD